MLKKMTYRVLVVTFALISFLFIKNIEAKEQINFKNITIEDGLTQSTIEVLFQDSKGYIWIGSNDGLSRYNGYQFKTYRVEEDIRNSLVNNYILDIKEDYEGNIWVATANGLSKINNNGQSISNYLDIVEGGSLSHGNINSILITQNKDILVGTANGLNIYDKKSDKFTRIFNGDMLINQYINSLAEDGEGNIWVGTEGGISKINLGNQSSEHFKCNESDDNTISSNEIYKVYYDPMGYIWAGTYSDGACKIDLNTYKITTYHYNDSELSGDFVRNFLRDSKGNLWVATNTGLCKYDDKEDTFITYKNKIYDRNSLVDSNIYSIIQDSTGLIWIGTYAGISIFNPDSQIQHYKNDPFDEKTISDNMVSALYEDKDGAIWMGSRYSGIDILSRDADKIINISNKNYGDFIPSDDIRDIVGYGNNIYIGSKNAVTIIDKKKNTVKTFDESDGLSNRIITNLFYDDLGYLWIGTSNGIVILDLNTEEIIDITYILEKYSPNDRDISDIFKDKNGEYWIGTFVQGGLIRLSSDKEKVTVYKNIEGDNQTISNNSIRCINEDINGDIWIGTSFGINKFDKKSEKFKKYTTKDGMANNTVYGILFDSYGNPWWSSNVGISKLNIETGIISNLDLTDGLQSNEFNGNAYFKNKNGEFLFGGINGFNIINPDNIKDDERVYDLVFDELQVNGINVDRINLNNLEYYQNNVYIEAFLPNYKNPNSIQYYYFLEGGNNDWVAMDGNSITLSNLSPGSYVFRIKARGNDGTISNELVVPFVIKSPFWYSKYAILIYILAICIFILQNKYKVKELDNMVYLRTKDLDEEMKRNKALFDKVIKLEKGKNNYLINLSHELRTPLNVIYSTEQLIRELNKNDQGIEKNKLDKYMEIMQNNTKRLLKIINDLIDTSKIEHGSYRLEMENIDIVYVVEEAALSLRQYIEDKGIELIIDPEIEEKIIEADANEIERCIVNIVGNASKFTNSGGYIKVEIKDLGDFVNIEISDNGIGIDKKNHELIFNRFNQVVDPNAEVKNGSGLGLTITKRIIDLHNGEIYVSSELGKGSKFTIILPVKQVK